MTPLERAGHARELLKSPAYKSVMAELRAELIAKLEGVALTDFELEHEAVRTLQVLKQLEAKLQRIVEDGEVEKKREEGKNWIERQRQRATAAWRMR